MPGLPWPDDPETEFLSSLHADKLEFLSRVEGVLSELACRLRLQSELLKSVYDAVRASLHRLKDFESFTKDIADMSQNSIASAVVEIQSAFLDRMQKENDLLRRKLDRCEADARKRMEEEKASSQERLEEQKATLEASLRTCQICEVTPRNVVILPCFHGQYCSDCLGAHQKSNNTCPTCRSTIRSTIPYFA